MLTKIILGTIFTISCNNLNSKNFCAFKIPIEKVNFKLTNGNDNVAEQLITFESKVPLKPLSMVKELSDGKSFKFSFEVNPKKINKNTVKIPLNGNFKLTVKKGIKFSVIDNDGTDGNAIIEIPENAVNYFLGVPDKDDDKKVPSLGKITVEDKLYYIKQEIKQLTKKERKAIFEKEKKENEHKKESENKKDSDDKKFDTNDSKDDKNDKNEKDHYNNGTWYTGEKEDGTWYNVGKRALNVPSEWKTENGNNYVLNLTNEGLSNFILRGYKTSNANDFEYPDGVNLIGVKGGIVSLTGVGKIEIPEGALDKDIFISITQEKEAPEIIYGASHKSYLGDIYKLKGKPEYDFTSSVVKLEPFGLELKKDAIFYLETNKARLGNNHPSLINWRNSDDKIFWDFQSTTNGRNIELKYWTDNMPTYVKSFKYYSKTMSSDVLPDAGYNATLVEVPISNNFQVQKFNTKGTEYVAIFKITYSNKDFHTLNPFGGDINEVKDKFAEAYNHFSPLNKLKESDFKNFNSKTEGWVEVNIRNSSLNIDGISITKAEGERGSRIDLDPYGGTGDTIQHEVWHVFQNAKNTQKKVASVPLWVTESSAQHMASRSAKKNSRSTGNYLTRLNLGLDNLKNSNMLNINPPEEEYQKNYSNVGFFTFLGHIKTTEEIFKESNSNFDPVKTPKDTYIVDIFDNLHLNKYHQYAFHAYLGDRFDIEQASRISIDQTFLNATNNKKTLPSFTLKNNSTKYYNFYTNDTKNRPKTLGLEIKSSCGSSLKARVLFFDSSDNPIVLPLYLDENNPNNISSEHENSFVDKIALNLEFSKIYPFLNFGSNFKNAVLVVSNSDGTLGNGTDCKFDISYCLYCFPA
ncbi:MAG: hypothetical protein AABZ74_05530 [Cyanobacteriota bacterium]